MNQIYSVLFASVLFCSSQPSRAGQLELAIEGFSNDAGTARIVLMRGQLAFEGKGDVELIATVPIRDGRAAWRANDISEGSYSVIAHHDTNSNNELDRPLFGIPTEPYGFSNGAWTSLGTPDWESVAFSVGEAPVRQAVYLRMNAFAVFGQIALIGAMSLAAIALLLTLWRRGLNKLTEKEQ